ncbi:TolB family protein [Bryobacter aggregatus]|uniref:TolB family protein n=1 Tax=Bryobacter aggregatus TaxID=360054 RepID=UPI0004E16AB2|nr:PD40 domain-containing protein [Bryobacter aggregatus]
MRFAIWMLALGTAAVAQQSARFGAQIPIQTEFLGNVQPLTTDGVSRKPHWSTDGQRLLIVSTEAGKCPQAYWIEQGTKERKLASSGKGSVRSAAPILRSRIWIFDSTQDAGEACAETKLGSVPASFNIFLNTDKGKMQRLASATGYDGEVDVSPSEKLIVYTSQASGDLEIWTMEFDGMNKRQLTHSPGYDGDPNFSNDGKRIVFRSHRARSLELQKLVKEELSYGRAYLAPSEIFVMDRKGSDEKQITSFGCTVLHPTWAPDNRRIVFASNLPNCAGEHFELFLVNLDGSGLVQLTTGSKSAGDASFSPDGRFIAYTRDGNVYIADWMAPAPPPDTLSPLSKP